MQRIKDMIELKKCLNRAQELLDDLIVQEYCRTCGNSGGGSQYTTINPVNDPNKWPSSICESHSKPDDGLVVKSDKEGWYKLKV